MTNGKDFMYDYLAKREKDFENWCIANGREYITDKSSEEYLRNWHDWQNYNKEQDKKRKEEEAAVDKEQREIAISNMRKEFERTIPTRFKNASLSDVNMIDELKAIFNGASALVLGENGVGKTHIMWDMMRKWVEKGETCIYVKAQELLYNIKTKDNPYKYINERFDGIVHIVVDEIDKIFESRADFMYFNYLVDRRYEWEKQIVFVGNGDVQTFIAALGQSIFSRLGGNGGVVLELTGEDKRIARSPLTATKA